MSLDLTELEEVSKKGRIQNIGSVITFVNNINRMYKIINASIDDYQIYYRGHSDETFLETPSIYRSDSNSISWIEKEDSLCDEIVRECPSDFQSHDSAFDKLVKMQHYGLPTRLLDITENPLVALYFACLQAGSSKGNGEILIYFVPKDEIYSHANPVVEALSCISFVSKNSFNKAKTNMKEFVNEMHIYASHLPFLSSESVFDRVLCVRAKKSNPRIIRQHGAFFLFGAKNADKTLMSDMPFKPFRMTVSKGNKRIILQELERYGISEKSLFPEIDKVAHHIKSH